MANPTPENIAQSTTRTTFIFQYTFKTPGINNEDLRNDKESGVIDIHRAHPFSRTEFDYTWKQQIKYHKTKKPVGTAENRPFLDFLTRRCSEKISCMANNLLKGSLSPTTQYSLEKWLSFILGLTNWKALDGLPWSSLTFIKGCRLRCKTRDYFGVFGGFGLKLVMA